MSKLQDLRLKAGLSQSQLAKLAGIQTASLQHYEIGFRKIDNVKIDVLVKIANALNCQLYELLEDKSVCKLVQNYEESIVN